MNYDIKITNSDNDDGLIEFDRLSYLTQSTKEIAIKAMMLKLAGFSEIKPSPAMQKASSIKLQSLSGSKEEGTHLLLNCDHLSKYIKEFQSNAFNPSLFQDLQELTPMALVIQTFRAALIDDEDRNNLDKPLLKSLIKFKKNFADHNEVFHLSNRQSIPSIELKLDDFKKIELIDESIPEPNKVTVNGKLDEMKHSKSRVVLLTAEGTVNAFIKNQPVIDRLAGYFGKELTIRGMAHYRPGGKLSHIEIQEFSEPNETDRYFSRIPNVMTAEQQVLFQIKARSNNTFANLIGKWPGDEKVDEILNDLD